MQITRRGRLRLGGGALLLAWLAAGGPAAAQHDTATVRVKDVATLDGVQPMPLIGYGLVVGLNKTGDRRQTVFSTQTLANMLQNLGLVVPGQAIKVENVAAVLVTGELPAFARPGARLDVTVSSVGDARSLQGGTLIATALRGIDGAVYALAQGPLTLGGFGGGRGGNSVQVNHLTAGRVPGGALVQLGQQTVLPRGGTLTLSLRDADFATARRLADAINLELGDGAARPIDAGTVGLVVPPRYEGAVPELMAQLEQLPIDVDAPARVVVNERTGTVVVGANVRLGLAAVAHGNLSVRISTRYDVSQPAPFSSGETQIVPQERVEVDEAEARLVALPEGATLDAVVQALNALGATPRDIIAIMQALRSAGALRAELIVI
ncbi:MAG: flagellar basal body P-ring protein FlgI [Vicinamibacteraceae bacterium]|nr:flagellar basal body P-ring protein FlgI [Vicinamibacteraceae bacterium]